MHNNHAPFFPAKTAVIHHDFDDPPRLAEHSRNEKEAMGHYRRVRDEIREYVETMPELPGRDQTT